MTSVKTLNPKAEVMGRGAALFMNINAAKGLHDVMKTNLGPKGTIKMLVGGAGGQYDHTLPMSRLRSPASAVRSLSKTVFKRRHQADKGRQRASQRDADPKSNSSHDC